ncbi:hypothetical protein Gorai_004354, partial [Gossypium raimondii]|nr:hypothetical protein [Gossypium raimondii]
SLSLSPSSSDRPGVTKSRLNNTSYPPSSPLLLSQFTSFSTARSTSSIQYRGSSYLCPSNTNSCAALLASL